MRIRATILLCLLLTSSAVYSSTGFVHESGFSFPPFTPEISRLQFVDYNNDGQRELLAVNDTLVILWDIAGDSVVFSNTTDTLQPHSRGLVADVNADSIPDIVLVIASPDTTGLWPMPIDWNLICFDGASGFVDTTTATFHSTSDGYAILGGYPRDYLAAQDMDDDGDLELLFSYTRSYYNTWESWEDGSTVLFERFPDSIRWTHGTKTAQALSRRREDSSRQSIVRAEYSYVSELGPDAGYTRSRYFSLSGDGVFSLITAQCSDTACDGAAGGFNDCLYSQAATGNVLSQKPGDELVVAYNGYFYCQYDGGSSSVHRFALYTQNSPALDGALEEFWSIPIPSHLTGIGNFLVHPDLPGYFFGIAGDTLIMFNGENGSIRTTTTDLPSGQRYWDNNWPDSLPRLVVMNGHQVDIYTMDITTELGDEQAQTVPQTFLLGQPYPNPFNAETTIPINLPKRGNLKVEIYNLLGQTVSTLVDREQPAGEIKLTWDASEKPSGVYLVRAVSGDKTETRKLLLLK